MHFIDVEQRELPPKTVRPLYSVTVTDHLPFRTSWHMQQQLTNKAGRGGPTRWAMSSVPPKGSSFSVPIVWFQWNFSYVLIELSN